MKKYNPVQIKRLTEGGSERNFYRVRLGNKSVIYLNYSDEKEENKFYYDIALFLKKMGINVPEVYFKEDGNIFLEDLGDVHLYNLITTGSGYDYYYKVIDQLKRLHSENKGVQFKISNGFDYSLYRWESKYFLDNLIRDYFGVKLDIDIEPELHLLAEVLSKEKNVLIHRDCQSKNIMIKDGEPYFIDFQGLRYGLPEYDLASLLEDPYVNLSDEMKNDLRGVPMRGMGRASDIYAYCAIQRLMQALGAYAFLGLKKGKREFLQYIPNGLNRLRLFTEEFPRLNSLISLIMPSVRAGGSQPVQKQ